MQTLSADWGDIERWRKEKRHDILRFAVIIVEGYDADLWVDENGVERARCPFVRKNPNSPKHRCTIYETRPGVCRRYEPWASDAVCVEI
jgi:Fe-S-cluster containining protein